MRDETSLAPSPGIDPELWRWLLHARAVYQRRANDTRTELLANVGQPGCDQLVARMCRRRAALHRLTSAIRSHQRIAVLRAAAAGDLYPPSTPDGVHPRVHPCTPEAVAAAHNLGLIASPTRIGDPYTITAFGAGMLTVSIDDQPDADSPMLDAMAAAGLVYRARSGRWYPTPA